MPAFQPAPGVLPPGRRVYAVGDVHGCDRHLAALHGMIAADLARRPVARPLLVHLGDYVDRGPDSAGVLARLAGGPPVAGMDTVNLAGNHEQLMLEALEGDSGARADWLDNGGGATLASLGADPGDDAAAWAASLSAGQLAFLRGLAGSHREGGYLFAHAGVRPGVALDRQAAQDLLWIRERFLESAADFGAVVVHGHTPRREVEIRANRIGIDTGAVFGGVLTCAILEGDRVGFLQAA